MEGKLWFHLKFQSVADLSAQLSCHSISFPLQDRMADPEDTHKK